MRTPLRACLFPCMFLKQWRFEGETLTRRAVLFGDVRSDGRRGEVREQGGGVEPGDVPHRRRGDEHGGGGQERRHLDRGRLHATARQRHPGRLVLGQILHHRRLLLALRPGKSTVLC